MTSTWHRMEVRCDHNNIYVVYYVCQFQLFASSYRHAGWGWVIVAASFVIHLIADGITFSFGVIYAELLDYFQESKGYTAVIGSLFMATPLLSGPLASSLTDRFGCRAVTIAGSIVASLGLFLTSLASKTLHSSLDKSKIKTKRIYLRNRFGGNVVPDIRIAGRIGSFALLRGGHRRRGFLLRQAAEFGDGIGRLRKRDRDLHLRSGHTISH